MIEKYLREHDGKDPHDQPLAPEDLVPVKGLYIINQKAKLSEKHFQIGGEFLANNFHFCRLQKFKPNICFDVISILLT